MMQADDDWNPSDDDHPSAPPNVATLPFARGDHVEIAQRLLAALRNGHELVYDDGELYRYEPADGLFIVLPDLEKSRIVQSFAGCQVGKRGTLKVRRSDVAGAIALAHDRAAQPGFFAGARDGMVFENAFVSVTADGITATPHAAEHRARSKFPFAFSRSAAAPLWSRFLTTVFAGDEDADLKGELLQEYAGACALGLATRWQRALVLVGEGANGKSVATSVIEAAMPTGSTAAIPPQTWAHEYQRALLAGKRLNVVSELPEADILDSESFKSIVAGDTTTGRHVRERPFSFKPIAGHIFAANRLPGTNDQSHGFWRRLSVLEFNRQFAGRDQRKGLASEIIAAELPGVAVWLLEGAQRLLSRGSLNEPPSSTKRMADWHRTANRVALFLEERTERLPDTAPWTDGTQARHLYNDFRTWCTENGHRPMASNKFGEELRRQGVQGADLERGRYWAVELQRQGLFPHSPHS